MILKKLTKKKLNSVTIEKIKALEDIKSRHGGPDPCLPMFECDCRCFYYCGIKEGSDSRLYTINDEHWET